MDGVKELYGIAAPRSSVSSMILAFLRTWRESAHERRALAERSACDLVDFGVPPCMAAAETRRWPWQPPSRDWQSLQGERQYLIDAARWSLNSRSALSAFRSKPAASAFPEQWSGTRQWPSLTVATRSESLSPKYGVLEFHNV